MIIHNLNIVYLNTLLLKIILHIKEIIALSLICGGLGCLSVYLGKKPRLTDFFSGRFWHCLIPYAGNAFLFFNNKLPSEKKIEK